MKLAEYSQSPSQREGAKHDEGTESKRAAQAAQTAFSREGSRVEVMD